MSTSRTSQLFRPWVVVTLICLLYALAVVAISGGPLELVKIGTRFSDGIPAESGGTEGYDGQFVYYIARDPSNAVPYLDVPAYRFQRILLPALGMALSFGQAALIPWALLVVNLAALAAGTALMEHLLRQHNVSRWYALGYGLTLGTFGAVRLSLTEPLAYALVLGGITFIRRERWIPGALLFALSGLAKETALIFAAGYALYLLIQRRWMLTILFTVVSVLPFIVWQLILYDRLGAFGIGSGGALATPFETLPFMGVIRILTEGGVAAFLVFGAIIGPFAIIPTLWGLRACWRDLRGKNVTPYTYLLFVNAAIMLFVPFSTYREPLGILRFIVGLQIAVILYAAERRSHRVLMNSTIWSLTLMFIVFSDLPLLTATLSQQVA